MNKKEIIGMTKEWVDSNRSEFKNLGRILWITKMLHRLTTQKLDTQKEKKLMKRKFPSTLKRNCRLDYN